MSEIQKHKPTFEDYSHENGMKFWWASEFANMLGYASFDSFMKPINRAITACMAANIDHFEDFDKVLRVEGESSFDDFKLTRFACYMIAMNADSKKPQVARAQVYFADQVEKVNVLLEGAEDIERLQIREDIKSGNTSLGAAAKGAGVVNFGLFTDAGYRGLYNRNIKSVKKIKGIPETHNPFDYMGRTELAANLFRISLTEEKLKKQEVESEQLARNTHHTVGAKIRDMVIDNTGKAPEDLAPERRLNEVRKELKKINKELKKKDEKKK